MNPLPHRLFRDERVPMSGRALAIGFGSVEELKALIARGFDVTGIEKNAKAADEAQEELGASAMIINGDAANVVVEEGIYSLITARNVLPFIAPKETMLAVLEKMIGWLAVNGFAVFTLFGPRDSWAGKEDTSFIEYDEAVRFIESKGVSIYFRSTEEGYGPMMNGVIKFWHIHSFIVQKEP